MTRFRVLLLVLTISVLAGSRPAHAYLDPGSGSMILQLLLGGVAGLLVVLKLFWQRLLVMFKLRKAPLQDAAGTAANPLNDKP